MMSENATAVGDGRFGSTRERGTADGGRRTTTATL